MFKSLVTFVVVLAVGAPAAAQESGSWSSTLTAEESEVYDPDDGTLAGVLIGYQGYIGLGELSDPDFDFSGTTYTFQSFVQVKSVIPEPEPDPDLGPPATMIVSVAPWMFEQDLKSLIFTLDGHRLAVSNGSIGIAVDENDNTVGSVVSWHEDPGFRWTDGQRIAIGLNLPPEQTLMCPVTPQSQCQIRTGGFSSADSVGLHAVQGEVCVECNQKCTDAKEKIDRQLNRVSASCGAPGVICGTYTWYKTHGVGGISDTLGDFIGACFWPPGNLFTVVGRQLQPDMVTLDIESSDSSILQVVDEPDRIDLVRRGPGAVTLFVTAKKNGEPISALSYHFQEAELSLDFAHFANGDLITSDLVLLNAGSNPIRPAIYFYDQEGEPIAADSVVDIVGDLEILEDGSLSVRTSMEPLGELTISTHGRGNLLVGSVTVVAAGPIGGVLRFDIPGLGVAGVGDSQPVRDAIFPVRRQEGGINTGVAIRNQGEAALVVRCHLMQAGAALDEAVIPLAPRGQIAQFIDQAFPGTDTADFSGSVRCETPEPGRFSAIALELDSVNRIFTTLPVVPVPEAGEQDAAELDFAHFANGGLITSDLVLLNASSNLIRPAIYFYDQEGEPIAADSVVDIVGDLEILEDGSLSVRTSMEPLGELTISTHGRGNLLVGSVTVVVAGPIGGVLRFDIPGLGVAGVGDSQPIRDAIFPVRRQEGGINTGVAIRNQGEAALLVRCHLMQAGAALDEAVIPLAPRGQIAQFIDQAFPGTDTADFSGSVRCETPEPGRFSAMALELDSVNRIFTTLPVVPVIQ